MSGSASIAGHLVHGTGIDLEPPTWPTITAAEAEAVLARYPGIGRLIALCWHSPRPFSAATLLRTGCGAFLLKRHHRRLRSTTAIAQEHAFVVHLRAAGLPVPEVLIAGDGESALGQGEWTYELHRKSPGLDLYRDRPSWTPFLSRDHARAAGVALARLHLAARGFAAPARVPQPLVASLSILPAPDPLAAAERYIAARPALAAFLAGTHWREELGRLFAALGHGLADRLVAQTPLWTHGDWHPSNLLWTERGEVRSVIDFGLATRTCALHDLATAIERTAVEWLRLDDGAAGDAGAAIALLAGYASVAPLTASDIETVGRLLPLVHVEYALSEVDYFAGVVGATDQALLAWDGYLIGHADWFLSRPGRVFLDDLRNGAAS